MGLILPQIVEMRLNGRNVSRYRDLGYDFPKGKHGDFIDGYKFYVHVLDLSTYSNLPVKVQCDCCGDVYAMKYSNYNIKHSDDKTYCNHCFRKIFYSGKNHPQWNENITIDEREHRRKIPGYNIFTRKVLARDNYTCQCCNNTYPNKLEVHHLDGYDWCKEKRLDVTNGITLCKECHSSFHSHYGMGKNTKEQFEEWMGITMEELEDCDYKIMPTKKIYCVEDDILYDNVKIVSKKYNCSITSIYKNCRHATTHAKEFHFLWEDEYKSLSKKDLQIIKKSSVKLASTQIICTTTGIIFDKLKDGADYYSISRYSIGRCCRGITSCTKNGDTNLKWMYYEDFLKLPIEEQNEILSRNKDSESSNDGSFLLDKEAM